jgi:hypothetical protein
MRCYKAGALTRTVTTTTTQLLLWRTVLWLVLRVRGRPWVVSGGVLKRTPDSSSSKRGEGCINNNNNAGLSLDCAVVDTVYSNNSTPIVRATRT